MNCKKNANSNPGEERQLFHPESEKVVEIGLERLRPFKNHPFKVKEDEAMAQLMESIERYGILNPLIVMPTREGVYQTSKKILCRETWIYPGTGDHPIHERRGFHHFHGGRIAWCSK